MSLLPPGSYVALGIAWGVLAVTSVISHVGVKHMLRASFVAIPFVLAPLPLIFTREGEPLRDIALGPLELTISGEGLRLFATIILKSWICVQAAALLTFTTTFPDLVEGLRRLRLPHIFVAVVSLMYRYIAVIGDEATRMMRARAARSGHADGSGGGPLFWRMKVVGGMVGSLFIRSYERSERIYAAMQSRGFDGEFRYLSGRSLVLADWSLLVIPVAALIAFELTAHFWLPRG